MHLDPEYAEAVKLAWSNPVLSVRTITEITANSAGSRVDNKSRPQPVQSDIRLKRNVKAVGATFSGLKLYSFRYNWSEETFVGVMAQEVLEVMPEAVVTRKDGFYAVNYDMLGLTMISLDKWRKAKRIH